MKMSLRTAHRVVTRIDAAVKSTRLVTIGDVNPTVHGEITDTLAQTLFDQHQSTFNTTLEKIEALHNVRALFRELIGRANVESINGVIIKHRTMQDTVARLKAYVAQTPNVSSTVADATALAFRMKAPTTAYSPNISINLVSEAQRKKWAEQLIASTRELEKLQDELAALNANQTITIDEKVSAFLQENQLM